MTQHSTRAASPPRGNPLRGRLLKRSWPVRLVLVAALLLAVPFLFHSGSTVHAADNEITGVTLTSTNPGELAITWDAPSRAPDDYRVTWKKSDGKWPSYKNDNTVDGGNGFPTGTSHTVTGLEEGTEYSARVRARYHDGDGNITESGPWSDPPVELTIAALPDKPTGLSTSPSHDRVDLSWTDPGDSSITSYQVLRGPDADNLAVLNDDTGNSSLSYTDSTVTAETTYAYAIKARNADGLSPQSDPVSVTTPAAPLAPPAKPAGLSASPSHDNVVLSWTDPSDSTVTSYQILRGPDRDNLAVLTEDTGSSDLSYTDSTVAAETTYAYAIKARNADGLGPQSDAVSVTTPAAPALPAKPTGITYGASHKNALMFWTDPDDDSITGYQILRGPDAANLAVLTEDTGSTDASYSDDTVEPETQYFYAIRARNAGGLGSQSDPFSVTTGPAPVEPESDLAIGGTEFTLDGQMLDTTGACDESDITQITDDCTINIASTSVALRAVDARTGGTFYVKVDRDKAALDANPQTVAALADFNEAGDSKDITFEVGRNLMLMNGGSDHFFRVNVVPYWEWNGERLSKDSDCRDTTANAPAVGDITDADCIVKKLGDTAELRFFNVIKEQFNVYVEVNETNVINEPSTTDLGSSFTVNLDAGDNLIRIRLAAKGGQPLAEVYDSDSFYYKVAETDFLVSNLGHTGIVGGLSPERQFATQFTTGSNPNGYTVSEVRLPIAIVHRRRHPRGCDLLGRFGQPRRQHQDADQPRQHNRIQLNSARGRVRRGRLQAECKHPLLDSG